MFVEMQAILGDSVGLSSQTVDVPEWTSCTFCALALLIANLCKVAKNSSMHQTMKA